MPSGKNSIMSRLREFETLLKDLQRANAKGDFTKLFRLACAILELDDDAAAVTLDTSRPNASRWRRGEVVPPASALVLKFVGEHVETKIEELRRLEAPDD